LSLWNLTSPSCTVYHKSLNATSYNENRDSRKNPHMDLAGEKEREQDIAYVAALIYTCSGCLLFLFYKSRPCSIRTMASANSSATRFVSLRKRTAKKVNFSPSRVGETKQEPEGRGVETTRNPE
jgi:hypothetical protein